MENNDNIKENKGNLDTAPQVTSQNEISIIEGKHGIIKKIKMMDKRSKVAAIIAAAALIMIGIIIIVIVMGNMRTYGKAEDLMEKQQYAEAIETLKPLAENDYKDSKQLIQYIEAMQKVDEVENMDTITTIDPYSDAITTFQALGNFRDSEKYVKYGTVCDRFCRSGTMSISDFSQYADDFSGTGDIRGSNLLADFFNNLAEKKYDEAITSANEYRKQDGKLLTDSRIGIITSVTSQTSGESAVERVDIRLGLKHVAFNMDSNSFANLAGSYSADTVKSFKLKGMGTAPAGKVLVISKTKEYKESAAYEVNYSYTALFGQDKFPKNLAEVQYVVRVHEKDTFKDWYTGGGKRIPGVTESIYVELYNTKTKKVIAKSKTKNGPKLKKKYSYSGSAPSVIRPDWDKKTEVKKKLIKKMIKKIPE